MHVQISRRAELAIRALLRLDTADGPVDLRGLATILRLPADSIPQVVRPLVEAGWLRFDAESGQFTVGNIEHISLFDVVERVDGPNQLGGCILSDCTCTESMPCNVQDAWERARSGLIDVLKASPLRS